MLPITIPANLTTGVANGTSTVRVPARGVNRKTAVA